MADDEEENRSIGTPFVYHAWHETDEPRLLDVFDNRRWSIAERLFCWQCTSSLLENARNNLLWNLAFQALGIMTVVGQVSFEGEIHASDIATLIDVAIAVPLLSLLAQAIRRQSDTMLKALNQWVLAVTIGYGVATILDLVGTARWGAACYAHESAPASPHSPPPPPLLPGEQHPFRHRTPVVHPAVWYWPFSELVYGLSPTLHPTTCFTGHRRATGRR